MFTGRMKLGGRAVALISPVMLAQSRTTISFLILAPILLLVKGRNGVALKSRELLRCMFLGIVGVAGSNFFYYFAVQKTTVATAIILQYTAPVFVLLYMVARRLQKPTLTRMSGVGLAVTGSMLAIGVIGVSAGFPWVGIRTEVLKFSAIGVASALVAAFAFSFWNIYGGHLIGASDRWRVVLWSLFGAAVGWQFINPLYKVAAAHYQPQQWLFMFGFAICSSLIPFSLYIWGLQHLDPTRAIVTSCLEPVFAIVIAATTLGETVNAIQIVGIVFTLAATMLIQLPERAEPQIAVEPLD